MRILFTADAELPVPPTLYGGIERIIASLIEELRRCGYHVGLVAHRDSTIDCDFFRPWPGLSSTSYSDSFRNALTLRRAVRDFKPDVLHSFSRLAWLAPLSSRFHASLSHPRVIIMSYQREPSGRTVSVSRWLHPDRLHFVACSEQLAEKGRERGGGDWTAVPNFVDERRFDFVSQVSNDAPLVFLSRIERVKGCHTAIAIAKRAGRRLLIAGNRVETGSSAGYWEREIEPNLGKDGIEYVGPVDDVQKNELLGKAGALLLPIEWDEPFGIVFVEALACGTPVIATPRGAVPEIVLDGIHGFHVNGDEDGENAIKKLSSISRDECRARVENHYAVSTVARQYTTLYKSLLIDA